MNKLESILSNATDVIETSKIAKLLKKEEEKKKKKNVVIIVLAIIGGIIVVAAAVYGIYRFLKPNYLEDFEDEFEDEFDDDFFEEDCIIEENVFDE